MAIEEVRSCTFCHRPCLTLQFPPDDRFAVFPFCVERHLSELCPYAPRAFAVFALELVSDPDERTENNGAIIVRQVHDTRLDDETAKLDQVLCALPSLDLPASHVMPCPLRLMAIARRPVAAQRGQRHRHLPVEIDATGCERRQRRAGRPCPQAPVQRH
jgi:hypothetical protein